MPGPEIGAEIVETALTFLPALENVPVLGRILRTIAPNGGDDVRALEEAQRIAAKRDTDRKTRIAKNGRYVLKASDAMQCVSDHLNNGAVLLAIGKGVVNAVGGLNYNDASDILNDRIFACIESKVLKQTGKRKKKDVKYYGRPARGHGHGKKALPKPS